MASDLEKKNDDELRQVIADATAVLKARDEKRRKDVEKQIRELAHSAGLSVDIKASRPGRNGKPKDAAKFRNPDNASQTWNGIGKRPQWIRDALAAGKTLEDFAG